MFEQSLVRTTGTKKPLTILASAALQAAAVLGLLLLPLLHTGLLPEILQRAPLAVPLPLAAPPPPPRLRLRTVTRLAPATAAPSRFVYTPPRPWPEAPIALPMPEPIPSIPTVAAPLPAPPAPVVPTPPAPEKLLAIGGDVAAARGLACARPEYPAFARQAGMQGTVELRAIIGSDGTITSVQRLSGNPVLAAAAIRAVRGWRYQPLLLDGRALAIETVITLHFALSR